MTQPASAPSAPSEAGQVVITRFECGNLRQMLMLIALHWRLKPDVKRIAPGYVGGRLIVNWRTRTILSLSIWASLSDIYAMGNVKRHVNASRVPRRIGVETRCGIYGYSGDWRRVMFGTQCADREPLQPIGNRPSTIRK